MIVQLGLRLRLAAALLRGVGRREYRRDRADEYAAPSSGGVANSYERPRSPTSGAGRAPMQSYGGRGGYSRPSDPRNSRAYMPPPPSRP